MKKRILKAFLTTVGFVSRFIIGEIMYGLAGIVGAVGFLYVFASIPIWVMNVMGLEDIENKPMEIIYLVEFLICLVLIISAMMTYAQYKKEQKSDE